MDRDVFLQMFDIVDEKVVFLVFGLGYFCLSSLTIVCSTCDMYLLWLVSEEENKFLGSEFTLDDYLDKSFKPKTLQTTWLTG